VPSINSSSKSAVAHKASISYNTSLTKLIYPFMDVALMELNFGIAGTTLLDLTGLYFDGRK
jgi:hypothetical protein